MSEYEELIFILNGIGPKVTARLQPPLHYLADDEISIALTKMSFYNSFSNVRDGFNNELKIKPGKDRDFILIKIPTGAYEISEISAEIIHQLTSKGVKNANKDFILTPNLATLKAMITLNNDYEVDFDVSHSIAHLLGFLKTDKLIGSKRFEAKNIVNINQTNSLLVWCNIARPNYLNGEQISIIYNAFLDVGPGDKFYERPVNLTYIPVVNNLITEITCWITDQNMQPVDFRHEELEIELKLIVRRAPIALRDAAKKQKIK